MDPLAGASARRQRSDRRRLLRWGELLNLRSYGRHDEGTVAAIPAKLGKLGEPLLFIRNRDALLEFAAARRQCGKLCAGTLDVGARGFGGLDCRAQLAFARLQLTEVGP